MFVFFLTGKFVFQRSHVEWKKPSVSPCGIWYCLLCLSLSLSLLNGMNDRRHEDSRSLDFHEVSLSQNKNHCLSHGIALERKSLSHESKVRRETTLISCLTLIFRRTNFIAEDLKRNEEKTKRDSPVFSLVWSEVDSVHSSCDTNHRHCKDNDQCHPFSIRE